MSTDGLNVTLTTEELHDQLSEAIRKGDDSQIAKLMNEDKTPLAASVPEPVEGVKVEEEVVPEVTTSPTGTPEKAENEPNTPATPPATSWEDGLSEEAKAHFNRLKEERDALDRKAKSELGRVPGLQRELERLKKEVALNKSNPQETPSPTKSGDPSPKRSQFAEKLAQLKEIDPALADIFEAARDEFTNPLREELGNEIKEIKNAFQDKEEATLWHSEKDKLLSRYPQADQIFGLQMWKDWKQSLTPAMKQLASSIYADEMGVAVEQFTRYAAETYPELFKEPEAPAPVTPPAPTGKQGEAARIEEERRKRVAAGTPAGTPATAKPVVGEPQDEDELFAFLTKQIRDGKL